MNKYLKGLEKYDKEVRDIVMERIKVVRDIMKFVMGDIKREKVCI